MLRPGRDPRREWSQQAAFEEAERLRAESRANAAFDSFIDANPAAVEVYDTKGKLLRSNKAAERLLGKVPPPGISLFEERGLKRAGLLEPQTKRVLAGTRVETPPTWYDPTEIGLPGTPGKKVCFRATVLPLFDSEGAVTRIAVVYEDVTEISRLKEELKESRVQATSSTQSEIPVPTDARELEFRRRKLEQALRESEERYRSLVDGAKGFAILRFSEEGRILAVSPSIDGLWGISADAMVTDPSTFFAQIHPDDIGRVKEVDAESRKSGSYPPQYQFRVTNKVSGAVRVVDVRGSVSNRFGRRTHDLLILDATDRVRLEKTLRDREIKLSSIIGSESEGTVVIDEDWTVQAWSPGAERETRVTAQEAVGKRLVEIYPDLEKSGFAAPFRKAITERAPSSYEGFYQDGRERYAGWFALSVYPFGSGALALVRNTSQRRKAEQAWQEAESKLDAILETPGLAVAVKDHRLRYVSVNRAALRMLGAADETAVKGKTDAELLKPTVAGLLSSHDQKVIVDGAAAEIEMALPDSVSPGSAWFHVTKNPLKSPSGAVTGILDVALEITSRVSAVQELAYRREYFEKLVKEHAAALERLQKELARWSRPQS